MKDRNPRRFPLVQNGKICKNASQEEGSMPYADHRAGERLEWLRTILNGRKVAEVKVPHLTTRFPELERSIMGVPLGWHENTWLGVEVVCNENGKSPFIIDHSLSPSRTYFSILLNARSNTHAGKGMGFAPIYPGDLTVRIEGDGRYESVKISKRRIVPDEPEEVNGSMMVSSDDINERLFKRFLKEEENVSDTSEAGHGREEGQVGNEMADRACDNIDRALSLALQELERGDLPGLG